MRCVFDNNNIQYVFGTPGIYDREATVKTAIVM